MHVGVLCRMMRRPSTRNKIYDMWFDWRRGGIVAFLGREGRGLRLRMLLCPCHFYFLVGEGRRGIRVLFDFCPCRLFILKRLTRYLSYGCGVNVF